MGCAHESKSSLRKLRAPAHSSRTPGAARHPLGSRGLKSGCPSPAFIEAERRRMPQCGHVLPRPRPQVAAQAFRRTGRAGARRPRADQCAGNRPRPPRVPVHRHARRRQDHDRAHLREIAELRARHVGRTLRRLLDLHRRRCRPLLRLCGFDGLRGVGFARVDLAGAGAGRTLLAPGDLLRCGPTAVALLGTRRATRRAGFVHGWPVSLVSRVASVTKVQEPLY